MKPVEIRDWRLKHNLTQQQLADVLGVQRMTVQRWEWAESSPPYMLHLALERLDQILQPQAAATRGVGRDQLAREAIGLV